MLLVIFRRLNLIVVMYLFSLKNLSKMRKATVNELLLLRQISANIN